MPSYILYLNAPYSFLTVYHNLPYKSDVYYHHASLRPVGHALLLTLSSLAYSYLSGIAMPGRDNLFPAYSLPSRSCFGLSGIAQPTASALFRLARLLYLHGISRHTRSHHAIPCSARPYHRYYTLPSSASSHAALPALACPFCLQEITYSAGRGYRQYANSSADTIVGRLFVGIVRGTKCSYTTYDKARGYETNTPDIPHRSKASRKRLKQEPMRNQGIRRTESGGVERAGEAEIKRRPK